MENKTCIRIEANVSQINNCKKTINEKTETFAYLANSIELIGNNIRLKIIYLLFQEKRLCVCDLSDILGMSVSAISQHLRKMKDRKLINFEKEAQTIYYSLTKEYENLFMPFLTIINSTKILEQNEIE